MRVALTGASGFIGSYTARALQREGHAVRALVRSSSRRDHIEDAVAEFVEGDLADTDAMAKLCDGVDAVIHNGVDWSAIKSGATEHFRTNLLATLDLLETARQHGVGQFLFVSSAAVNHEIVTTPTIDETHPTWPSGLYGAYKAAVEPHLKAYHVRHGMNTSSWRPAAVYGVDPKLDKSQWHDTITAAAKGERVDAKGGGKITHVEDVADALALAIGDEKIAGEVFNLIEQYLYWCVPPMMAKEIADSDAEVVDHRGAGPSNVYSTHKAVAFFDRHSHPTGLRRGESGVRRYVADLLAKVA